MIATLAARDQIVPGRFAAARTRSDVVQSQFGRRKLFATVLATRMIAQQNVLARKRPALERNMAGFSQGNHRRGVAIGFLRVQDMSGWVFIMRTTFSNQSYIVLLHDSID